MTTQGWIRLWLAAAMVTGMPAQVFAQEAGGADEAPEQAAPAERSARGELQPPRLLREVEAEYTEDAVAARLEGAVVLELTINTAGDVSKVDVVQGLGYGLDESAVRAVEQFKFEPARLNGEPIPVSLNFTVRFSLPVLPAEFTGVVLDPVSGEGIEGAEVRIVYGGDEYDPRPEASALSEADGSFYFGNVPPGPYQVFLQVDAYLDFETDIELPGGQLVEVEYRVPRAQENLIGEIREAGSRSPLAGVELRLLKAETQQEVRQGFSEGGGRFGFAGVEPGNYILRASSAGYVTSTFEVEVVGGEVTEGNYYMPADDDGTFRARTTTRRQRQEVNRQTIELDEVRRIPGTGGDVVRVVQNLPGVARAQFISGQIIVRGSSPNDTKIFLEGDSIPLVYHFFGGPAVINTEMVEAIDFYPGNFSPYYGRATAGVIDLRTRSPRTDRVHGMAEIDLLDSSAMVEGPINDRWSFAIAGRRSYYDFFLPSVLRALEIDTVVAPRYYDYQTWVTYRSESGAHKVEFFVYGSDDEIDVILPDGEPEGDQYVQVREAGFGNSFHRGQVRWEWKPEGGALENTLMSSFGLNSAALEAGPDIFFDLDFYQTQIRNDLKWKLSDNLRLRTGLDAQLGNVVYSYAIPAFGASPDDFSSPDGQDGGPNISTDGLVGSRKSPQILPAVYAEAQYKAFGRWTLTPGLRADYYGPVNEVSISPRLASRFELHDQVVLKGGVGLFTQPPIPGQTEEDFGNPDISYEKAMHYAVGAEWQPRAHLELDATLYYRDSFDLVNTTSAEAINEETGEAEPVIYDNEGQGRSYGLELLLRHYPKDKFFGWLSYTLSRSERLNLKSGEWDPYGYDQTHILTMVAGYNLPWNLDLSARFRVVTGNPQTPVVGAVFDADSDGYRPRYGEPNSERSKTFHQLDLRLDRRFIFDTWTLAAYLDVTNVYNAKNEEGTRYNYDYSDSEPLTGLPILPTIGVMARF
ncbi:TonB-dependent receptor domain-containing protein [Lujinxingia litoralis]|nr:TonB-dependent receptor [Lujinxingia litoralis]